MSMGLGMIYTSFSEINSILKNALQDLTNKKNKEYALLVITNFARHETIRKLVNNQDNLAELFTIIKDIMNIQTTQVISTFESTEFPEGFQELKKDDLQLAVY